MPSKESSIQHAIFSKGNQECLQGSTWYIRCGHCRGFGSSGGSARVGFGPSEGTRDWARISTIGPGRPSRLGPRSCVFVLHDWTLELLLFVLFSSFLVRLFFAARLSRRFHDVSCPVDSHFSLWAVGGTEATPIAKVQTNYFFLVGGGCTFDGLPRHLYGSFWSTRSGMKYTSGPGICSWRHGCFVRFTTCHVHFSCVLRMPRELQIMRNCRAGSFRRCTPNSHSPLCPKRGFPRPCFSVPIQTSRARQHFLYTQGTQEDWRSLDKEIPFL